MFQRVGSHRNAIAKGDVISITAMATLKGLPCVRRTAIDGDEYDALPPQNDPMRALLLVEVEPLALVAAHAEFAETKSLTTKHTKKDSKGTKKTERARLRGLCGLCVQPSSSSWASGLLTNFVFSWLPFVISIRATAQRSWRCGTSSGFPSSSRTEGSPYSCRPTLTVFAYVVGSGTPASTKASWRSRHLLQVPQ
jgi:hypothetical protein